MPNKKPSYDAMASRLVIITERLFAGQLLKVSELADEFDVSEKTIQRDFTKIKQHLNLESENRRWRLSHRNALDPNEMQVLEVLESMAYKMGDSFSARAKTLLHKLAKADLLVYTSKLAMEDFAQASQAGTFEKAIRERHKVSFYYQKEKEKKKTTISPLKMMQDNGYWYLIAYCPHSKIIKKYHLNSISDVTIESEKFRVRARIDEIVENAVNIWFDEKKEPFIVKLFVDKQAAKYFIRKPISKTQKITPQSGGSIELEVTITHEMEIIPLIKQWMPLVLPLEPTWIIDRVRQDTEAFCRQMDEYLKSV